MAKKKLFFTNGDEAIHLHSENGTAYELAVDNSGALTVKNEETGAVSGGGSGSGMPTGGAPHQQLVTDAEGKALWEDRTHYTETVQAEVIPETECINVEGQFAIPGLTTNPALVGVNHRVVYNGVGYDCVGMLFEEDEMSGVALGNAAVLGGEMTEHPFCLVVAPAEFAAEQGICGLVMPLDGAESVTVSVEINGEYVKKLDNKYIDTSAMDAVVTEAKEAVEEVNQVVEEVQDAIDGKMNANNPTGTGSLSINRKAGTGIGVYSSAVGVGLTASDYASHAEGEQSSATGRASHAEGYSTTASGDYSHAEGYGAVATGYANHAEGDNTYACGECQHVQGRYNKYDIDGKYLHIVGNGGTVGDDGAPGRSNAHTLDWGGNAWFAGYVEGTKLILPSPNGTRWAITVGDDGTLSAAAVTE